MTTVTAETTAARAVDASKTYGDGRGCDPRPGRRDGRLPRTEVHGDHGPVGLGQEHADAVRRRSRPAHVRVGVHRRHRHLRAEQDRADAAAARPARLHLPAVQPDPDAVGEGEHPPAADARGRDPDAAWFDTIVDTVGLGNRLDNLPSQLSGGQQQRVAVARALVPKPDIVFADEPTGALDSSTGTEILTFMRHAVDETGQTIVMVTHDPHAASYANNVLFLADGQIVDSMADPTTDRVLDRMKQFEA